jgi:ubiquinone/menaquinone biosynthesis C-methylase UbiE
MRMNWVEKWVINSPFRLKVQRMEARKMLQFGGDIRGGKALEIGCGRGTGIEIIFDTFAPAYLEAFDSDPDQIHKAKQRLSSKYLGKLKLYEANATKITAPDNTFDAVFDFGVLHHIPDNESALLEIARVLKPGGRFFFMEIPLALTMNPVIRLLTDTVIEAQFTADELMMKLATAGLVVSKTGWLVGATRILGVARKNSYQADPTDGLSGT